MNQPKSIKEINCKNSIQSFISFLDILFVY